MNILVITLLTLTSLLTSTISSPQQEVIVKEGHRVVVVEYDKEAHGETRVSISPDEQNIRSADEKPAGRMFSGQRDLVCDAFGKCRHKVAKAIDKTKDMVMKTAHGVTNKVQEIEQNAQEAMKTKDMGMKTADGATNKLQEIEQNAQEAVNDVIEKRPQDLSERVSEKVTEGFDRAKKLARDTKTVLKEGASKDFDVIDSPKRIVEDIAWNVSGKVQESAKETVKNVHLLREKSLGEIVSKLKEVVYDVIWYLLYRDKMGSILGLVHVFGFSTAYGMCVWVTFVSSYVLGRYLPRQMFGMVQSRLYPVYFKAMAYCVSAALLGHLVGLRTEVLSRGMGMFQSLCLVSALLMVLTNLMALEPKATKAMYERMKIEKEEGRGVGVGVAASKEGKVAGNGPNGEGHTVVRSAASVVVRQDVLRLNEKLKRLNAYSSALNLFTLVALTWHMAYLGQRLQATRK